MDYLIEPPRFIEEMRDSIVMLLDKMTYKIEVEDEGKRIPAEVINIEIWNMIKEQEPQYYRNLISVLFCDAIEYLLYQEKKNQLKEEETSVLEVLKGCQDLEDVDAFFQDENVLALIINAFYEMQEKEYLEWRQILKANKKEDTWIESISPYHKLDKARYCMEYTVETMIAIYHTTLAQSKQKKQALFTVLNTIQTLMIYDRENYNALIANLADRFYQYATYHQDFDTPRYGTMLKQVIEANNPNELFYLLEQNHRYTKTLLQHVISYTETTDTPYEDIISSNQKNKRRHI